MVELIFYNDETEYGVTFQLLPKRIIHISKASFIDGNISSYTTASCFPFHKSSSESLHDVRLDHYEEYFYENSKLSSANVFFSIVPKLDLYDKSLCIFNYNENSIIHSYDEVRCINGEVIKKTFHVSPSKQIMR